MQSAAALSRHTVAEVALALILVAAWWTWPAPCSPDSNLHAKRALESFKNEDAPAARPLAPLVPKLDNIVVPPCSARAQGDNGWGTVYSTGFGPAGNDPTSPNAMRRLGVSRGEALAFIAGGADTIVLPCPFGEVVGVGATGARRFLCGLKQLSEDAPLFSFGSNGDFRFEDAVRELAPRIPVVVFDPTLDQTVMSHRAPDELTKALDHARRSGYTFVPMGIGYQKGWLSLSHQRGKELFCGKVDTLPALLARTPHSTIGVLKIDASGEFEVFAHLEAQAFDLATKVGILLLEVHLYHPQEDGSAANCCYGPDDWAAMAGQLRQAGFVLVGRELGDCCAEFSWVNPAYPGFL